MGRKPCCAKEGLNRGAWSPREDMILSKYVEVHGEGKWRDLPQRAGLNRCGKSCRLRWLNYLRPGIKRGNFAEEEEDLIIRLHKLLGNRWSLIAGRIPGRTDNEIKNYWNTTRSKKVNDETKSKLNGPAQHTKPKPTNKPPSPTKQRRKEAFEPHHHEVIRTKPTRFTRMVNVNKIPPEGQRQNSSSSDVNDGSSSEYKGSCSFSSSGRIEDQLLIDYDMDLFLVNSSSTNFDQTNENADGGDCYGLIGDYFEDDDDHFRPDDYSDFDHVSFAKFLASEAEWNV